MKDLMNGLVIQKLKKYDRSIIKGTQTEEQFNTEGISGKVWD